MQYWHNADLLNRMYINIGDGKKAAMPRYYKQKIYTDDQRKEISGYQKGKIELETITTLSKYEGNSSFAREKHQAIKSAYDRMYKQNKQRNQI